MPVKPPKELKALAKVLAQSGFTLSIPFDDVRAPGYIGTYNQFGQEIIVDDGRCLKNFVTLKTRRVVLGNTTKTSKFSLGGFLKLFGGLLGLNFGFQRAKSVSIRFPKRFVPTKYITIMDIEEDWHKFSAACRKRLQDPASFLIVQVLQTDSIEYVVEVKKKLSVDAKLELDETVKKASTLGDFEVKVAYESDKKYSLVVKGKPMSVGYKRFRIGVPLEPES